MRSVRLIASVIGCVLGVASGTSAQVPLVVAGQPITAASINAIINAVNSVGAYEGNLDLPSTNSTTGQIRKSGVLFLHAFGTANTFLGGNAGNVTMMGNDNTGIGSAALNSNTFGYFNVAVGGGALFLNSEGENNTAIGYSAGSSATTGRNNVYIGAWVTGAAGESNTMYLGKVGTQTKTFIAGVRGITTGVADAVDVLIDSAGQLGTVSSSRRYKRDIKDMGHVSAGLLKLRPVTFRYTQAFTNGTTPTQYGLIAEEVAEIYPDVVVYNDAGQPETVQYRKVNALLLNEVQRQHRQIAAQQEQLDAVLARLTALEQQHALQ